METISGFEMMLSLHFGMYFWLDEDADFCYCPANVDGTADEDNWGYVSEWTDLDGVNLDKLFYVHKSLVIDRVTEYEQEKVQAQPSWQTGTLIPHLGGFRVYNEFMYNPNTTFNPALPYAVVCDSAPHENSVFKTLDECWGLCLDLSEEYGYSEIWYGKCLMGSYKNGQ